MKPARAANRRFLPDSPFNSRHVDSALVVDFGSRQVRIMWPFAKLTKL